MNMQKWVWLLSLYNHFQTACYSPGLGGRGGGDRHTDWGGGGGGGDTLIGGGGGTHAGNTDKLELMEEATNSKHLCCPPTHSMLFCSHNL